MTHRRKVVEVPEGVSNRWEADLFELVVAFGYDRLTQISFLTHERYKKGGAWVNTSVNTGKKVDREEVLHRYGVV